MCLQKAGYIITYGRDKLAAELTASTVGVVHVIEFQRHRVVQGEGLEERCRWLSRRGRCARQRLSPSIGL